MEFNEKLQKLRNQKGATQEEVAEALFVSRAAVSKWESGRGYPNIDSLKAIAKYYDVTVDELLSSDELLTIAQEDAKEKEKHLRDLVFGLLDISVAILFFLPFFGQKADETVQGISLLSLTAIEPYLKLLYLAVVILIVLLGILTLALQNLSQSLWVRSKGKLSLLFTALGAILFVVSLQPYAAVFLFVILAIKVLMLINWQ